MTVRGVLLDFSGTLFRLEPDRAWVDDLPLDEQERTDVLAGFTDGPSKHLPPEYALDWQRRDLDSDVHRRVYIAALRAAGLDRHPGVAEQFYQRLIDPTSWIPYLDTGAALRLLAERGIPVCVLSNIAWDIRDVFVSNGLDDLVDAYVLSYEEGLVKPDPKIFLLACERIGVAPEHALMIGDSAEADGGARQVGCRFERVEPQPTGNRPDALISALRANDLAN